MVTESVSVVVLRLRARRKEIEEAIFARVRDAVQDPAGLGDAQYVVGLRATVAAAVDFVFRGIECGDEGVEPIPSAAVAQARRAVRAGVSLDTVLRRYTAGYALLSDFVVEEAESSDLVGQLSVLRQLLRMQASSLERLTSSVAEEYGQELERVGRSGEQRRAGLVQRLLAGAQVDAAELGYRLDGWHLAVIAKGPGASEILREAARGCERQLLCVACGEQTVWAWFGGQRAFQMSEIEGYLPIRQHHQRQQRRDEAESSHGERPSHVGCSFAAGEPARGLEGWRLTHRQAQAALMVALSRPRRLTRYVDVALLATTLKDEALVKTLIETYIAPLRDTRGGGRVLRETLHAYLAAERNVSSAAAALGVVRKTVEGRLRTIEERTGRSLHPCPTELEIALELHELGVPAASETALVG